VGFSFYPTVLWGFAIRIFMVIPLSVLWLRFREDIVLLFSFFARVVLFPLSQKVISSSVPFVCPAGPAT